MYKMSATSRCRSLPVLHTPQTPSVYHNIRYIILICTVVPNPITSQTKIYIVKRVFKIIKIVSTFYKHEMKLKNKLNFKKLFSLQQHDLLHYYNNEQIWVRDTYIGHAVLCRIEFKFKNFHNI